MYPNVIPSVNWIILYFVYGQVFFLLSVVTGLRWRRKSRLDIARCLPWLAAFGLAHGINEWGYIFIPFQATYLSPAVSQAMVVGHLLLLAASFAFLLRFGIELLWLASSRQHGWVRIIPFGGLLLWGLALFLRSVTVDDPFSVLIAVGDGWSRYFLCFPGAILTHLGLQRQARQLREAGFRRISIYLSGAALAFSLYALFSGLIVPASPILPARFLNYTMLIQVLGVPTPVFRSACGLAMTLFMARFLEVFQAETDRRIEEMERAQLLNADRERIGRDLHDGIIQNIYAAGLSLEDIQHSLEEAPPDLLRRMQSIMKLLDQTIQDIRRYIFDLQAAERAHELESILEALVRDLRLDTMLNVELELKGQRSVQLSAQQIANLTQVAREGLSNVVQHAAAKHVVVQLHYMPGAMQLAISDDGVGIAPNLLRKQMKGGGGIANMVERARLMGGTCSFESTPGQGFKIAITVPCADETVLEDKGGLVPHEPEHSLSR